MTAPDSYLEKFPVDHRNSVNRAYEDGYLDGLEDAAGESPPGLMVKPVWVVECRFSKPSYAAAPDRFTVWHRLPDSPHLLTKHGPDWRGAAGLMSAVGEAQLRGRNQPVLMTFVSWAEEHPDK